MLTEYATIRHRCLNHLRTQSINAYQLVLNGGWHFSFLGGLQKIKQKIQAYGHQEFNNPQTIAQLKLQLDRNRDFAGRRFKFWSDSSNLPQYLVNHQAKYQALFK